MRSIAPRTHVVLLVALVTCATTEVAKVPPTSPPPAEHAAGQAPAQASQAAAQAKPAEAPRAVEIEAVAPPAGESRSITVSNWQPFLLKDLPDGELRVKLELRDKDGVVVPGPWNSAERVITVRRGDATASP